MRRVKGILAFSAIVLGAICLLPASVQAADTQNFATISTTGSSLVFGADLAKFDRFVLTISGPDGSVMRQEFAAGSSAEFSLFDDAGYTRPDGSYAYELRAIPELSSSVRREMAAARASGDDAWLAKQLKLEGIVPAEARVQSGFFAIHGGSFASSQIAEVSDAPDLGAPTSNDTAGAPTSATFDQVFNDDLIVLGSACIGLDCSNGESFGFDTLRLKENNLRIKAQDTSASASFPTNDWQITFNESSNGGANKFSIDDIDGGRTPFTIEASAPSNSLYVDNGGRMGLGTNSPVVEVHVVDGDTPTVRLEQDGSSGFTPQTWDLASNETNFFLRDVTNGSRLPFRVRPSAPTSSIDVAADGDVGFGTTSPGASIHVLRTSGDATALVAATGTTNHAKISVTETNADTGNDVMLELDSAAGAPIMQYISSFRTWSFSGGNIFAISAADVPGNEMTLNSTGDLTVAGTVAANNGADTLPDYVFEPDYDLMELSELKAFIEAEKHLPGVPSKADVTKAEGVINMTEMQMKLLEKVEELTLYTLQQQELIQKLEERLASLETQ